MLSATIQRYTAPPRLDDDLRCASDVISEDISTPVPPAHAPLPQRVARFTRGPMRRNVTPAAVPEDDQARRVRETVRRFTSRTSLDELLADSAALQEDDASNDPGDYAYAPEGTHPSEWKLPIHDSAHVSAAIAAIGKGFRGNRVDLPADAVAGVKRKIRAAWRKHNPDKSDDEMPEAIRESADDTATVDDGDWPLSAHAAAAASKKAHASSTPEDHLAAAQGHHLAAEQASDVAVRAAHRRSADAHLASVNATRDTARAADFYDSAAAHQVATSAWHDASGGKFGLGRNMADLHAEQEQRHTTAAVAMANGQTDDDADDEDDDDEDETEGSQESFDGATIPPATASLSQRLARFIQ